jgi:NTP pyrophosphatase (non-canonical NTP hydrolase)
MIGPASDIDWTSIRAVQAEITAWASSRFPHRTDHHAIYKLMVEEIPELAMHLKEHGTIGIGPELADCFILLMDLASLWNVDLVGAIREKMLINYSRQWSMDVNGIMQHLPTQDDSRGLLTRVTGIRCPVCESVESIEAANVSNFQYRCITCCINFNDSIPY